MIWPLLLLNKDRYELLASKAGISSIIQPGGSLKDNLSIETCDLNNVSMVFSGIRHFYH